MAKLPSTSETSTTHKKKMKKISFSDWEVHVAHLLLQLSNNVHSLHHHGGGDSGREESFGEEEDGYPKRRIKKLKLVDQIYKSSKPITC
uniref:Uncharacterized protein n=1 Tax=Manihot esculenta TaxID=3983 RepID=A0A2C9VJ30_MANES